MNPKLSVAVKVISPEVLFERELEIFRTEAESATQFFYAYLTIHAVAGDHVSVRRLLNTAPLFWNTNLGALQTAAFIVIGRIFDQGSTHNIDQLLRIAQANPSIFSTASLGIRKQGNNPTPPNWLAAYLRDAYVPTSADFRVLRARVHKQRKIYEARYRDLRHKLFAHKEVSARSDVDALFAQTNIRELQKMLAFLGSLYTALWQLFINGRKPVLRPLRYSVRQMRNSPSPTWQSRAIQERITHEVERFLHSATAVVKQRNPPASRSRRISATKK